MASKIYALKEQVAKNIPEGEIPRTVFSRLMLKTGIAWATITPETEVSEDKYEKALKAARDILGDAIQA